MSAMVVFEGGQMSVGGGKFRTFDTLSRRPTTAAASNSADYVEQSRPAPFILYRLKALRL